MVGYLRWEGFTWFLAQVFESETVAGLFVCFVLLMMVSYLRWKGLTRFFAQVFERETVDGSKTQLCLPPLSDQYHLKQGHYHLLMQNC